MRSHARRPARRPAALAAALTMALLLGYAPSAHATLIIEPVINRVAGSGPSETGIPLYDPTYLVDGVAYYLADEPGELVTYAAGDPPDPELDVLHIWNNTRYDMTGFTIRLIGTATHTLDPGSIVRGPVDAVWGDADGDGKIGQSDIFSTITVSADGKEIHLTGGLVPADGRFTDVHLARSDNPPQMAGFEAFFDGVEAVPEPPGWALTAAGLVTLAAGRRLARLSGRHRRTA